MPHLAYNSGDISQVHGSRVVGLLHGKASRPFEQSVPTDEPVSESHPSMSSVPFTFVFLEGAFLALMELMLAESVAFWEQEFVRTCNIRRLVFSFD